MIKSILTFLSGKKAIIASIILTTTGYLGAIGKLDSSTIIYIGAMTAIIFGAASVATSEIVYPKE